MDPLLAGVSQPEGSQVAESVRFPAFDQIQDDAQADWFWIEFMTFGQMGSSTIEDFLNSGAVQVALGIAGVQLAYMARFELGPLQSLTVPGFSIEIAGQTFTSPYAGQVVEGSWRNSVAVLSVKG